MSIDLMLVVGVVASVITYHLYKRSEIAHPVFRNPVDPTIQYDPDAPIGTLLDDTDWRCSNCKRTRWVTTTDRPGEGYCNWCKGFYPITPKG